MIETTDAADANNNLRRRRTRAENNGGADRLPPHAIEAEQGVLGCALLAPADVLPALVERHYSPLWNYDLRHQHISAMLLRLFEAGSPVDLISLQQALKDASLLEEIGGIPYLNQLQDATPSGANWSYYCDLVREKWKLRTLVQFCTFAVQRAYEFTGTAEALFASLESDLDTLLAPMEDKAERHIKAVLLENVMSLIERHYSRGHTQLDGLPTGADWYLDKVLLGLAPSDYVVLAGRPGEGKTSLALNIVDYLATKYTWFEEVSQAVYDAHAGDGRAHDEENNKFFLRHVGIPIGVFTLEMTEDSLGFRLVFSHARVSTGSFRQGFATKDDWDRIHAAVTTLSKSNIYLDGEPDQTMDRIAAKARRWAKQYGIKLFVLDYLQLLDSDQDTDRLRVLRRISKKIVSLKKRLKIPWLVLAQMNRNIETAERARRPVLSDLKESGSIEQDADKIIFLYHPLKNEKIEEDEERIDAALQKKYGDKPVPWDAIPRRINALVAKNRNGPTGVASLLFQNNQCLFHDWRRWQIEFGIADPAAGEPKQRTMIDPEDVPRSREQGAGSENL
jgi:replicative DNA helicase